MKRGVALIARCPGSGLRCWIQPNLDGPRERRGLGDLALSHSQSGNDVVIAQDANDSIMLKNTTVASLQQSNFHFT